MCVCVCMCVQPQLLSHSALKPAANELEGSAVTAEPGFCTAAGLDFVVGSDTKGGGGQKSHGSTRKPTMAVGL